MTAAHRPRPPSKARAGVLRRLARFLRGERGNVATLFGLLLVPIIGSLALATEASNWFLSYRAMQNAADSAVLAAANNGNTAASGSYAYYQWAGLSVASGYGYAPYGLTNGSHDTTVSVQNKITCPNNSASTACYQVTITHAVPIYLTALVGYQGTTTSYSGAKATLISVSAIAGPSAINAPDCILSLATTGTAITSNGGSNVDLSGCTVMSNSSGGTAINCNGHDLNADNTIAVGSVDSKCSNGISGATAVSDPYAAKAAKIPKDPCGGTKSSNYPQEPSAVNTANTGSFGAPMAGKAGYYYYCGDVQLTGNVTVTDKRVVVIYNGQLDINGNTLSTSSTGGLTVIFAGQNKIQGLTPFHNFADNSSSGKGVINIAASTTDPTGDNTWGGVAMYQSPYQVDGTGVLASAMTDQKVTNKYNSLDITAAGSSPTLDITGLTYLPNAAVTLSGAIDKSQYGAYCFVLVVNTMTVNGSGSIFQHSQSGCPSAGTTQVYSQVNRFVLLQ
ncbi:TadE/TadG family type IV pilus assembly protein [Caulobacter sp. KR2-114]|uniref:TadE/TadG family type IV pilus assembly protein n=1 Tax=Caulobacter sp. KR2-114 TaxID=3400912 RepID=UPI003C0CFC52